MPNRTKNIIFSVLAVAPQKTTHIFPVDSPARAKNTKLLLAEKSNKCDRRIIETLKKNFVCKERVFYRLNQRTVPDKTKAVIFLVLAVTPQKTKNILSGAGYKTTLLLVEKSNKCDPRITKTLQKILPAKREYFTV